jgi:hypothetical protein
LATPSIRITGTLLSAILYECANSKGDSEGFLTGSLATRNSEHVDDSSDERVRTQEFFILLQGYYPLTEYAPKFYNWRGEIFPEVLEQLKISSSLKHIVGYFKFRRQTRNQVSLREGAMFRSLRAYLMEKGVNAANICLGIACAAPSYPNMETHTYDYSFWTVSSGSDELFEKAPVGIVNIMDSTVEYKSFISNFSDIPQSPALSSSLQQMVKSVDPDAIVSKYESMHTQAMVALKDMASKVTASELQVDQLRKEVEALEIKAGKEDSEDSDAHVSLSRRKSSVGWNGGPSSRDEPTDLLMQ